MSLTVTRTLSDRDIRLSPSSLTFTPADWNTVRNLTISVAQDSDQRDEGARFTLVAPGLAAVPIWVTGVDNDRTPDQPRAVITRPRSGDTISGTSAEFFGDGLDDIKVVRAQFLINDVVRYTDTNSSAHFHIGGDHNLWNTTTLADGVYVLELRVFDNIGKMGRHTIKVRIDN